MIYWFCFYYLAAEPYNIIIKNNSAEGSFTVYPKTRYLRSRLIFKVNIGSFFHLSLYTRDKVIIEILYELLNKKGTIYEYDNKPDVRLAINDKKGLLYLFYVFDSYMLFTKHAAARQGVA